MNLYSYYSLTLKPYIPKTTPFIKPLLSTETMEKLEALTPVTNYIIIYYWGNISLSQ
jgi:hypothetical protein